MKELAKTVLLECTKRGARDTVVNVENDQVFQVKFSNNKILTTETSESSNLGIFLNYEGRIVATTLRDFSRSAAHKTVRELISFAKTLPKNKEFLGIADGPFKYRPLKKKSTTLAEMSSSCIEQVTAALDESKSLGVARLAGVMEAGKASTTLITSGDIRAYDEGATYYFSGRAFTQSKSSGHSVCSATSLKDMSVIQSVRDAARIAKESQNPATLPPGKYDVVFEPLAAANIIENIGIFSSIFYIESGMSFLKGKIGKKVASDGFTLTDDPTNITGVGSSRFDAEGAPTRKIPLVENGVLRNHLHNTSTAKRHKTQSTGSAGLVYPEPHNLVLEGGNVNKASLISGMKTGLIVTNVWYTRFQNSATGEFSTVPRDGIFLVKDKKMTPVKDIRISDNIARMIQNVPERANDDKWIVSWEVSVPTRTPSIKIQGVNITRSVN